MQEPKITTDQFTELMESLEVEIDLHDGLVVCQTRIEDRYLCFYGMRDQGYALIQKGMGFLRTYPNSIVVPPTDEQIMAMQSFLNRMGEASDALLELHRTEIEKGYRWPEELYWSKYGREDLEKLAPSNGGV